MAFDDSEKRGEGVFWRFVGQQVDVFGHDDVCVDHQLIGGTGLFNDLFEGVFRALVCEIGKTTVTTEGDEVKLACLLSSFEAQGHSGILACDVLEKRFELRSNAQSCTETEQ